MKSTSSSVLFLESATIKQLPVYRNTVMLRKRRYPVTRAIYFVKTLSALDRPKGSTSHGRSCQ